MPNAELTAAEQAVATAIRRGQDVDLRSGDPAHDSPANAAAWGAGRAVRAEVLAELLLGEYTGPADKPALRLSGARVTGLLHLAFSEVDLPVTFRDCVFDETPDLYQARTRFLSFAGCALPGLIASNLQVEGDLRLTGCHVTGELRLRSARISSNFSLNGAHLEPAAGAALNAEHLDVGSNLLARDGFRCDGEMILTAARIGAAVNLEGARLSAPGGLALGGSNLVVQVGLFARAMTVEGEVSFRFARVCGPLTLRGSVLRNPGGLALHGGGLNAEAGLHLSRVETEGTVWLEGAAVGRALTLDGARLRAPGGVALRGDRLTLDGALLAREGMSAEGEISLTDASISGPAHFKGATLVNPGGAALSANGITVGKVLNLCEGFSAQGRIRLTYAQIGSRLCFDDATLEAPGGKALTCRRLEVRELAMRTAEPVRGAVDLRHARIGVLQDDAAVWPDELCMDGLSYEVLEPMLPAAERLAWLRRDPEGYLPNAYEQLAAMYRRLGSEADARATLLAGQQQRRGTLPGYARFWGHLQDATVGYGFRPLRAAAWLVALLAVGTVVFQLVQPPALKRGEAPDFNAFMYSLDLLLPIIDFGQEKAFNPGGGTQWLAYGLIAAGWVLATTIAAGLTRTLRRA
ncbi:oxidoreductase [Nonomuraea monospora]|uniref:Oxidoreductase n=1 Tax=Nonomuraea monospora TaxID=568818 RepID=A0ABP5PGT3_9ACTN